MVLPRNLKTRVRLQRWVRAGTARTRRPHAEPEGEPQTRVGAAGPHWRPEACPGELLNFDVRPLASAGERTQGRVHRLARTPEPRCRANDPGTVLEQAPEGTQTAQVLGARRRRSDTSPFRADDTRTERGRGSGAPRPQRRERSPLVVRRTRSDPRGRRPRVEVSAGAGKGGRASCDGRRSRSCRGRGNRATDRRRRAPPGERRPRSGGSRSAPLRPSRGWKAPTPRRRGKRGSSYGV